VELEVDSVLPGIPYLTDDQLVELYEALRSLGRGAWKAQAAILWESKQRSVYGDKAWEAAGRSFGLGWQHAYKLARVWDTFFKGPAGEFSHRSESWSLQEVTWYITATETEAPHYWLAHAEDRKAQDPGYTISDFKTEIRKPAPGRRRQRAAHGRPARAAAGSGPYCTKLERVVRQGECEGCDVLPSIEERLR
jgi:hypothetical protein